MEVPAVTPKNLIMAVLFLFIPIAPAIAGVPPDRGQASIFEDGIGAIATSNQPQIRYGPTGPPATAASATMSSSDTGPPPEPSLSYIDNVCGMLPDGRVRVRESIFSSEISGCLLGFRPEQVAQAPQGRGPRAPQPSGPGRIIDRVIELVAAPELDIAPSDIGLTGLETYVWIDEPAPVSVSASAGGTTVDARAFPSQYLWDWGDGSDTLTYDSGRPWTRYRPGNIGHVYETRGRYDLSVEVVWEAQWRINGGAWQALGFFSLGDSVDYPVRQVQARLTRTNN
jgi:hypothetical protein